MKRISFLEPSVYDKNLKVHGIKENVVKLIKHHESVQRFTVFIDKIKSGVANANDGVSKGSLIFPLLFLIYVNDQIAELKIWHSCSLMIFALADTEDLLYQLDIVMN